MNPAKPPGLPLRLLVLDFLGTLLVGLGAYELATTGDGLLPAAMHSPGYAWALILIGLVIMLPASYGIVMHFQRKHRL